MDVPNAGELLVQQTQELEKLRERLRLLKLANECQSIEELRKRLNDLLNTANE